MKWTKTMLAAAIICAMATSGLVAQELQQPASVKTVALGYDYYAQADAEYVSDEEASPSDADAPVAAEAGEGCSSCGNCGPSCSGGCCCKGDPWKLFCNDNCWGIEFGGWVSAGFTANADDPASRFNGPVTFNDRAEGQLNQGWFFGERALQDDCCGWQWGGRFDVVYGTDARFTKAAGLELRDDGSEHWNSGGQRHYQLALPQMYAEFGYNDLRVKVGHFFTIIGYEVVPANGNFFYSHAYTMQYGEPFTHTGVLADWKYSDQVSFQFGMHYGWDAFDNINDNASFLGGVNWTSCDERTSVAFAVTSGEETGIVRNMYSVVVSHQINDCLTYVVQHDNGWDEDANGPGLDNEWYGLNQYLFRKINDCWTAGLRFEWFRDDDGSRVGGPVGEPSFTQLGPFQGNFYEITAGLNWTPTPNLTVRPELRWDWSDGTAAPNPFPFDDGTKDSQFLAAFDFIWTY